MQTLKEVLVTGGAGYIGAVLVPKLLRSGYRVNVLDLYPFGGDVFSSVKGDPSLREIKGDIRDQSLLRQVLKRCDAVIHLARNPIVSGEQDPEFRRLSDYNSFRPLVRMARETGVRRFIYASSCSVYGIQKEADAVEETPLILQTDYARNKALSEEALLEERSPGFVTLILRPAQVSGFSPRTRLGFAVNAMVTQAFNKGVIRIHGGDQRLPTIHMEDMTDLYLYSLQWSDEKIDGRVFNAGNENHTLNEIAEIVRGVVGDHVDIIHYPAEDPPSFRISSEKIRRELGYAPQRTVEDAVRDLVTAFRDGRIPKTPSPSRSL